MISDQELLEHILNAHGGRARWNEYQSMTARMSFSGELWKIKGHADMLEDTTFKISLHTQQASFPDFPGKGLHAYFEPELVTIFDEDAALADHLFNPRNSLRGQTIRTPWQLPQLVYFAAYATWNYLTAPFNFTTPGVKLERLPIWEENGERWEQLAVTYPAGFAVHNRRQLYFFGADGLLHRHHYFPDVLGGAPTVQFVSGYREFSGIQIPTARRVFMLADDGSYLSDPVLAEIQVHDILFE